MLLIGLTGGIGSGKSTVSAALAGHGAVVVDADRITRELQEPGTAVFDAIVERFGEGVVATNGTLDRQAIADIVFGDDDALADLNGIVHPAVGVEMQNRLERERGIDRVVVLDVPLLVEALGGSNPGEGRMTPWGHMAGLVVVDTDPEVAVARLVDQRGFTEEDARARMARQASREERMSMADFVVPNNGTRDDLAVWIERCWDWISELRASGSE